MVSMKTQAAAVIAFAACFAKAEPIRWMDGSWDDRGVPRGRLLTDNPRWFGDCVFTGVSYSYECAPLAPEDIENDDRDRFGRRLLDGDVFKFNECYREVGRSDGQPIVAKFDFKRPCSFSEFDIVSRSCRSATGFLEFSDQGREWTGHVDFCVTSAITRVFLRETPRGRYVRLSVKSTNAYTAIDEVYAWGDGEISARYPEAIADIPLGSALAFSGRRDGGISVLPMRTPYLDAKPTNDAPNRLFLRMARNETESRYFAVVNESGRPVRIGLAAPDFGEGVSSELLIGGVVRMTPPKRPLSQLEMVQLMVADQPKIAPADPEKLDVWPYFTEANKPEANFCRRYLANYRQVVGFPRAVPLGPGEGCIVMLRVTTMDASSGMRRSAFRAGQASVPYDLMVANVTLPRQSAWIYACRQFTQQRPFESATRRERDARRIRELGVTVTESLPEPGSKAEMLYRSVPGCFTLNDHDCLEANARWLPEDLYWELYHGKIKELDASRRKTIEDCAHRLVSRVRALGVPLDRFCLFLPDEPGRRNMKVLGEMCRLLKRVEPELLLHMNPCFWENNGLPPDEDMISELRPFYNELIDVSNPMLNLVEKPVLLKDYWSKGRRINAQYIHPARRAGRMMAYSSYRHGFNGFCYYCYYEPGAILPWDIRSWNGMDYMYLMAFPLENDVALTPLYESMREAAEDWRLLDAVKAAGKAKLLEEILNLSVKAWDRTDYLHGLYDAANPDFLTLRDRMLEAF